jgi:hypothetical protein
LRTYKITTGGRTYTAQLSDADAATYGDAAQPIGEEPAPQSPPQPEASAEPEPKARAPRNKARTPRNA